jgi:DNA modification methylase
MTPWLQDPDITLYHGDNLDVLRELPDKSVHMCCTSPPFYGLRDYGTGEWEGGDPDCDHAKWAAWHDPKKGTGPASQTYSQYRNECGKCGARRVDKQIGLEDTPDQWVQNLVAVFREVRRVLRDDGTLWVEIGDSYTSAASGGVGAPAKQHTNVGSLIPRGSVPPGHKPKDLLGQPWLLAFALRADGWYLRSEIIWARPNPMPESVTDRPTKSHSTVFLLSKQPRYFYDADAIREPFAPTLHNGSPNPRAKYPGGLYPNETTQERYDKPAEVRTFSPREPDQRAGANARSVWTIPTQPTPFAHFATWPEALCRRMILAGTSERGCCSVCGTPWTRDTETAGYDKQRWAPGEDQYHTQAKGKHGATSSFTTGLVAVKQTTGWSPGCVCLTTEDGELYQPPKPVPCTVLDPFAGSATTNLVARNHGRHSIGIELNEQYLEIAAKRLQQLSLLA